jgi:RNA polymerase sigma factor (sigma-70 family)
MQPNNVSLLDEFGQPLNERLRGVLIPLAPRVQRQFPALNDDCVVVEVLEEAGRRLAAREERKGPLDPLQPYAWVVVKRMAALRVRHDEWVVASATRALDGIAPDLDRFASCTGTAEQVEAALLARELEARLTPDERRLVRLKQAGLSTEEIAYHQGISVLDVSSRWRRVKRKLYSLTMRPAPRPGRMRG